MDTVEPAQPDAEFLSSRTCHRLTLAILVVGVLWRFVRYFLQFPMWGDEGMLAVNFYYLDYTEMTRRLENYQIAPLLFLWGERTALLLLGPGMLAMRLLPLLAGLTALALYWHLTGLLLKPRARLFAFAFLAVGIWPVSMCTLIKPYSLDLCMSLLLLVLATHGLRDPGRHRWLVGLTVAAPVALLGSYPAAFVAG
jgi:uncharacterized membrane protein